MKQLLCSPFGDIDVICLFVTQNFSSQVLIDDFPKLFIHKTIIYQVFLERKKYRAGQN